MRNSNIITQVLIIIIMMFTINCSDPKDEEIKVLYVKKLLQKGQDEGTFSLIYMVKFNKENELKIPVELQIRKKSYYGEIVFRKSIPTVINTLISSDLTSGKYFIVSKISNKNHRENILDGIGPEMEIKDNGLLVYSPVVIHHLRKIKVKFPKGVLSLPDQNSSVNMEWLPIKNAESYRIKWIIISEKTGLVWEEFINDGIKNNKFVFDFKTENLKEGKYSITWILYALNKFGISIGEATNKFTINYNK